jgi:hypothetical protein
MWMADFEVHSMQSMVEWIPSLYAVIPAAFVFRSLLHASEELTHRGYYLTRLCLRL